MLETLLDRGRNIWELLHAGIGQHGNRPQGPGRNLRQHSGGRRGIEQNAARNEVAHHLPAAAVRHVDHIELFFLPHKRGHQMRR